jgi:hypothetical protein
VSALSVKTGDDRQSDDKTRFRVTLGKIEHGKSDGLSSIEE